jgi:phage/plasmid-associated DNA primase
MLVNTYDDLPSMRMRDTGPFKILNGNGRAYARKIYKPPFYFWNYAKGTYSTNKLPGTRDLSHAFFKRWMIAEMPYTFVDRLDENGKPTKLGKNQKYKGQRIEARMTTPEMRSSWLNWWLDGLDRLRKNECFSTSKTQDEIKELWLRQTAPISVFAKECIDESVGAIAEKQDVYRRYQEWCDENDVTPEKDPEFAKTFKSIVKTTSTRPRSGGRRPTCWADIKLKGEPSGDEQATLDGEHQIVQKGQSTTEPTTAFGQGGQGESTQFIAQSEENNIVKEVMGLSPDHPDQSTSRPSLQSQVREHLELRAIQGKTEQTYIVLERTIVETFHSRNASLNPDEIRAALLDVTTTDKELLERCIDFYTEADE